MMCAYAGVHSIRLEWHECRNIVEQRSQTSIHSPLVLTQNAFHVGDVQSKGNQFWVTHFHIASNGRGLK